jgi:hypothetical protein
MNELFVRSSSRTDGQHLVRCSVHLPLSLISLRPFAPVCQWRRYIRLEALGGCLSSCMHTSPSITLFIHHIPDLLPVNAGTCSVLSQKWRRLDSSMDNKSSSHVTKYGLIKTNHAANTIC